MLKYHQLIRIPAGVQESWTFLGKKADAVRL
jgi:hypothetical protein